MVEAGDAVQAVGKLKKVVDFLSGCDKEDLRILASFFEGDAKGPIDAKRFKKPVLVKKVYEKSQTIEVEVSKTFVWEDKDIYFEKVVEEVPESE
jgi:hypothetical protein